MPRLITSTPAAFFSAIFRSSSANRYGGSRSRRLLGRIQLLNSSSLSSPRYTGRAQPVRSTCRSSGHLDLELAAVERDRDRARHAAQRRPPPRRRWRRCPEDIVSPTPRSKMRARISRRRSGARTTRSCGAGTARGARSARRSAAGRAPRARRPARSSTAGCPPARTGSRTRGPSDVERAARRRRPRREVALGAQPRAPMSIVQASPVDARAGSHPPRCAPRSCRRSSSRCGAGR